MQRKHVLFLAILPLVTVGVLIFGFLKNKKESNLSPSYFAYNFEVDSVLYEAGNLEESTSPYWWLNSGGALKISNGLGKTLEGNLPENDRWRKLYESADPVDTNNGYNPQNIFRLLTKGKWQNAREQIYIMITKDVASGSLNKNESNGILLFGRYEDDDNLYYAGLRVDGTAVIKKKMGGVYYTLAQKRFMNLGNYNHKSKENLLPKNQWIGLRLEIKNLENNRVNIKFYSDISEKDEWSLVLDVTDDNVSFGGNSFVDSGHFGMRSDFMEVSFKKFEIQEFFVN